MKELTKAEEQIMRALWKNEWMSVLFAGVGGLPEHILRSLLAVPEKRADIKNTPASLQTKLTAMKS